MAYASTLATDITALIDHLHPDIADLELYVARGSFRTVPAQILYGASYKVFPSGQNIATLLLIGAFTPFHCDKNYAMSMSWSNYIMTGPSGHIIPSLMPPSEVHFGKKFSILKGAKSFLQDLLFNKMSESEQSAFDHWQVCKGMSEGELEREMSQNVMCQDLGIVLSWS